MLASTEKRLGLIAASALTAAALLLMSQQHPLNSYKMAVSAQPTQVVQIWTATTTSHSQPFMATFSDKQHIAQHVVMR